MEQTKHRGLYRGNTRNVIYLICVAAVVANPKSGIYSYAALGLLMLGIFLHVLVKGSLIRNTKLCRTGPYLFARHPFYLANYMIDASYCLLTGNPYVLVIMPFVFFWGYGSSLRSEEAYLWSIHGDDFTAFHASTPQLLPDGGNKITLRGLFADFTITRLSTNEIRRFCRFFFLFFLLLATQAGLDSLVGSKTPHEIMRMPAFCIPALLAGATFFAGLFLPRILTGSLRLQDRE